MAVLASACMVQQLPAQGLHTARPVTRFHSRPMPGLRFSPAPPGSARVLRAALPGPALFGVAPYTARTLDAIESDFARSAAAWAADPYMSGLGDSPELSTGIDAFYFGLEQADEPDAFRPAGIRTGERGLLPLSPPLSIFAHGLGASANIRSSSALFSLTTLSRMLHGDFYLPFSSSVGGLRFDYYDNLRLGPKTSRLGFGSASAMFTRASIRKGMTFSAGALLGVRSTAFSTGGGLRTMASVAEKNTVPSLGMRLSF